LELYKGLVGEDHPDVGTCLYNLANFYESQSRYSKAEPLYVQALELYKRSLGENHPDVATCSENLAYLYYCQDCYSKAEFLLVQALAIYQQRLGSDAANTVECRQKLAIVRAALNSRARDLPNFNQKAKKGNSKKKLKGFGKG